MVAGCECGDDAGPRVDVVVEKAVVEAAEGDYLKEPPVCAVGAARWPVGGVYAGVTADQAGLIVNKRKSPSPRMATRALKGCDREEGAAPLFYTARFLMYSSTLLRGKR